MVGLKAVHIGDAQPPLDIRLSKQIQVQELVRHLQRRRGQTGFVLMESLVVSMLVAVTFLGLMGALFTAIRSSDVNRHRQRMEAALTSYGETLKAMPTYLACGNNPVSNPSSPSYDPTSPAFDPNWHALQPHLFGTDYDTGVSSASGMAWQDPPNMTLNVQPGVEVLAPDGSWNPNCPAARDGSGNADSGVQRLTLEVTSRGRTLTAQIVKTRPLS